MLNFWPKRVQHDSQNDCVGKSTRTILAYAEQFSMSWRKKEKKETYRKKEQKKEEKQ